MGVALVRELLSGVACPLCEARRPELVVAWFVPVGFFERHSMPRPRVGVVVRVVGTTRAAWNGADISPVAVAGRVLCFDDRAVDDRGVEVEAWVTCINPACVEGAEDPFEYRLT